MNYYEVQKNLFFDAELPIVPLKGKRPFINDWINKEFEESEVYHNCNLGLKTGEVSGIICVDIDVTSDSAKKEIYAQLPPLYCGKTGDRDKGINYFFKYNGEASRAFEGVDILSCGKQTVLPPSMHNNGYNYEWVHCSLTTIDIDSLPDLPSSFIEWCEENLTKSGAVTNTMIKSDGSRCNHGSHDTLSRALVAKIADQKHLEVIVEEMLQYDSELNSLISYFLCPSRKEWKIADRKINCTTFVTSAIESFVKKGNSYNPTTAVVTFNLDTKITDKKERKKFPHMRGIAQVMFTEIYAGSTKQRSRFALASALSTISVLIGNKIRIGNIHPNLYTLIIAKSGEGKDVPLKYANRVLFASGLKNLIGQANPASDSGILMTLSNENPKRLDTVDEADQMFATIGASNSPWGSKMADVYASLYTSCGEYYAGKVTAANKGKKLGECDNPFISIIAAMTPKAFTQSFTTSIIEKGLGARFLYFIDESVKKNTAKFSTIPIDARIIDFAKQWNDEAEKPPSFSNSIPEMVITPKAKELLIICNDTIENMKLHIKETDKMLPIYNRMYVSLVKLAIIDACSVHYPREGLPVLDVESIIWAQEFMVVYHQNMKEFIEFNVSENGTEYSRNLVLRPLAKADKGMTKTELYKATRSLNAMQRKQILIELCENEQVFKIEQETNGRKKTLYVHTNFVNKDVTQKN